MRVSVNLTPGSALIPYDVNSPLWSDNASKERWMAVPSGQSIGFTSTGEWDIPVGTVFVKHFDIVTNTINGIKKRRLETRILVRVATPAKVYGITYRWNAAGTDAVLVPEEGADENLVITTPAGNRPQTWHYPSRAECMRCHTPQNCGVLGVNTRQLNRNYLYGTNNCPPTNQLSVLNGLGYFNSNIFAGSLTPSNYPALASVTNTLASPEQRFRSYIDANCAHCHRPGGEPDDFSSDASQLFDGRYDTPFSDQRFIGTNRNYLRFGSLTNSQIHERDANDMPPLARSLADTNWLNFLRDFITNSFNPLSAGACNTATSNKVVIVFNRPVNPASGQVPGNYTISNRTVTAAVLGPSNTVTLTVTPAFTNGPPPQAIAISNVRDTASPPNTNWPGITVQFTPGTPPPNDSFGAARSLGSAFTANDEELNCCASKQSGEPNHAGNTGGKSVWWSWTAPGDGIVTIDTDASTFDTLLAVYTGFAVNGLTVVANNDDHDGLKTSKVSLTVSNGVTYSIAVDGYNGSNGMARLNLDFQEFIPLRPTLAILTPTNGAVVATGAGLYISVNAYDSNGYIYAVDYYLDGSFYYRDYFNPFSSYTLPVTPEGLHFIEVVAIDNSGGSATNEVFFNAVTVSNQPPIISSLYPTNGTIYSAGETIYISTFGYDNDGSIFSIETRFDGTLLLTEYFTTFSSYNLFGAALGLHTVEVTFTDNLGATAVSSALINVTQPPSNQPPAITIYSPTNGATYTTFDTVYLNAGLSDLDGYVYNLDYYLDGLWAHTDYLPAFGNYSWSSLLAGSHTIQLVATDNLGAQGSNSVTFTVTGPPPSNQPPAITIYFPTNGANYGLLETVYVNAGLSDIDGYVYSLDYYLDGLLSHTDYFPGFGSYSWSGLSVGAHTIQLIATDNLSARGSNSVTFAVTNQPPPSNQPPTVTIYFPTNGTTYSAGSSIYVNVGGNDVDGNVTTLLYYLDGVLTETNFGSSGFYVWTNASSGGHIIRVVATDNLGARGTNSVNITVQPPLPNQPPTVSIYSPSNGTVFPAGSWVYVDASGNDSDGNVTTLHYYVDGVLSGTNFGSSGNYLWTNALPGAHIIQVVATDNQGARGTNTVSFTMQGGPPPPPPGLIRLVEPQLTNGHFRFLIIGTTNGMTLIVDAVTNLGTGWTPIRTNIAAGTNLLFIDAASPGQQRYYRARLQ